MLGKCANPECRTSFRKLASGKLFTFELMVSPQSAEITSSTGGTKTGRSRVFFWLCDTCSLTFTVGLDVGGRVTLQSVPNGAQITILDVDKTG
jgi:hypothetical protein